MEARHMIAGFSEIKAEFILKTRTPKTLQQLQLWFSFRDSVLRAHDYSEHSTSMILASIKIDNDSWDIFLKSGSYGEKVIRFSIMFSSLANLQRDLNELYELHGFNPP